MTAPATRWFLAEGATGPFFDLFILLANPTTSAGEVASTTCCPTAATLTQDAIPCRPNSRFTIWVDDEEFPAGSRVKPLANVAVSTTVTSMNNVPIIVERTMWWPGGVTPDFWTEAHNSPGATVTGTRWALAEGEVGGPRRPRPTS